MRVFISRSRWSRRQQTNQKLRRRTTAAAAADNLPVALLSLFVLNRNNTQRRLIHECIKDPVWILVFFRLRTLHLIILLNAKTVHCNLKRQVWLDRENGLLTEPWRVHTGSTCKGALRAWLGRFSSPSLAGTLVQLLHLPSRPFHLHWGHFLDGRFLSSAPSNTTAHPKPVFHLLSFPDMSLLLLFPELAWKNSTGWPLDQGTSFIIWK